MKDGRATTSPAAVDPPLEDAPRQTSGGPLSARFGDDVALISVSPRVDARGRLVEFDFAALPFTARRAFVVTDVPAGVERGGHRHRRGAQVLFCPSGCVDVELRRGDVRHELRLTPATGALLIRAGVWARQRYVEEGSQLLVLASEPYDVASYETDH